MVSAAPRQLTERQRAVMERIDRRVPIKVIAQELGVSETRINQHIRALKDFFDAENLGDLVECYRASKAEDTAAVAESEPELSSENQEDADFHKGLSEAVYSKSQVEDGKGVGDTDARTDIGELVMNDAMPLLEQAPWLREGEPKVVPGVLDGEYAVLFRLGAIITIAFGFLAAVVLMVTAAITISEALDGRASVPVDEQGFS